MGWKSRAVRLDSHLEAIGVERGDESVIELKERLATRADDERPAGALAGGPALSPVAGVGECRRRSGPSRRDGLHQVQSRPEPSPTGTIRADEVSVAERADGRQPILFATRPEVAPSEPAKNSRAPHIRPFPLERVKDLFDGVAHEGG